MSRENVETVKSLFAAFAERDFDAAAKVMHPEVEIRPAIVGGPERTVYLGVDGNRQFWDDIDAAWSEFVIEAEEFRDLGDQVLVLGRATARGPGSGISLDQAAAWVAGVSEGRIIRFRSFSTHQEALQAAGLSEEGMSQEIPPKAEILEGYDFFNRRDFDAFIALHHEEVELFDFAEAPDQRVFRGHAGVREWIAKLQEAWDKGFVRFEPQSIVEGDGAVVVETRAKAAGGGSGVPVEMTFHTVMRFRDHQVIWSKGFINRADALEAAGLSE